MEASFPGRVFVRRANLCIVSCCFFCPDGSCFYRTIQVEVPGIRGKESYIRTYLTAYMLTRISFCNIMVSYIPRKTDRYQPKNTNSGCNSSCYLPPTLFHKKIVFLPFFAVPQNFEVIEYRVFNKFLHAMEIVQNHYLPGWCVTWTRS